MSTPPPIPNEAQQAYYTATDRSDAPVFSTRIAPHRSLSNKGFFATIMFTATAFLLPLLAFIGTYALWTLLPFVGAAVAALWYFIRRNDKDGSLCEHITIWPDLMAVHRENPRSPGQFWHANPYWVTVQMRDTKDCPNYLTLKGAGREIELGAFLTSEGRKNLCLELRDKLTQATNKAPK